VAQERFDRVADMLGVDTAARDLPLDLGRPASFTPASELCSMNTSYGITWARRPHPHHYRAPSLKTKC
jgi:hypothetical protein